MLEPLLVVTGENPTRGDSMEEETEEEETEEEETEETEETDGAGGRGVEESRSRRVDEYSRSRGEEESRDTAKYSTQPYSA